MAVMPPTPSPLLAEELLEPAFCKDAGDDEVEEAAELVTDCDVDSTTTAADVGLVVTVTMTGAKVEPAEDSMTRDVRIAVEAGSDGEAVTVEMTASPDCIRVAVLCTGVEMAAEEVVRTAGDRSCEVVTGEETTAEEVMACSKLVVAMDEVDRSTVEERAEAAMVTSERRWGREQSRYALVELEAMARRRRVNGVLKGAIGMCQAHELSGAQGERWEGECCRYGDQRKDGERGG